MSLIKDTFIISGGSNGLFLSDVNHKFDTAIETWIESEKLPSRSFFHGAVMVSEDSVNCESLFRIPGL